MAQDKSIFTCNECGASSPKWLGRCPGCGAWNTLVESVAETGTGKNRFQSLAKRRPKAIGPCGKIKIPAPALVVF